jgi:hypothetical protein
MRPARAVCVTPGRCAASYQFGCGHHIDRSTMDRTPLVVRTRTEQFALASARLPDRLGNCSSSTQMVKRLLAATA